MCKLNVIYKLNVRLYQTDNTLQISILIKIKFLQKLTHTYQLCRTG